MECLFPPDGAHFCQRDSPLPPNQSAVRAGHLSHPVHLPAWYACPGLGGSVECDESVLPPHTHPNTETLQCRCLFVCVCECVCVCVCVCDYAVSMCVCV